MSDLTDNQAMMMEVDSDMVEIFQSWFEKVDGLIELDDNDREMIFLHLRMAFVHGRRIGREDMMPLIEQHAEDLREIAQALRGL